jgi:hypothetical protein
MKKNYFLLVIEPRTVKQTPTAGLDAFAEEQTKTILAALDAKLEADLDAARARLEEQSDPQLNARVEKMKAALQAFQG